MKNYFNPSRALFALFLVSILFGSKTVSAQVNGGYTFTQSSGTYSSITGTALSFGGVTTGWDNNVLSEASPELAIPFPFFFNGVAYDSVSVNTNGYITFGSTTAATTTYNPVSATGAYSGAISAMGCDLVNNGTAITYTTLGTSPNQTFVIQWTAARRWDNGRIAKQADNLNFQIRLSQTTNIISVVYGTCTTTSDTVFSCQVGLRGANDADFNGRTSYASWSSTTSTTTDTASIFTSNTILPPSGLTFTWTPCSNSPLAMPVTQGFNSTSEPGCWNQQFISGTKKLQFVAGPTTHPATSPQEGSDFVYWNSYTYAAGSETRLISPPVVTTGTSQVQVTFYWYAENNATFNSGVYLNEGVTLEYSLNNTTWNTVQTFPRQDNTLPVGTGQWESKIVDLPAGAGNQPAVYVAFDFLSESGDNCSLDNVTIKPVPANDAGVSGFVIPTPLTPSSQLIQVIITNYGSSTLTSATVNWSVDGVAQTAQNFTGLSVAPGATVTESLGYYTFANGTSANSVTASTSLPNGQTDGNPSNDSYTTGSLYTALTGIYYVGAGQNFTSITNAVTYANNYGICGPTTFILTDAAYNTNETFPITLNAVTTAINTLTIKPNTGVTSTITNTTGNGIFNLNGAGYVTLNGGTGTQRNIILTSSVSGAYDIQTNNGCLNINVNNCGLQCNNGYNVDIEGTGVASVNVANCDIHDYTTGSYTLNGVYVNNQSASVNINGNNIYNFTNSGVQVNLCANGCTIANNNFYYVGNATSAQQAIYVLNGSAHRIEGNYIGGQSAAGGVSGTPWINSSNSTFNAIWIAAFTSAGAPDTISGNVIQNISLANSGSPAFYGINVQAGKSVIGLPGSGNTIGNSNSALGIVNNGATSAFMQGIWATGSALSAQYNTVANLSAPAAASPTSTTSTVGGIYLSNTSSGASVSNNAIYNLYNASPDTVDITESNYCSQFNVQGIVVKSSATGTVIAGNTIHGLRSTLTSAFYTAVVGIGVDSNITLGSIDGNLVYDLTNNSAAASTLPGIVGIRTFQGIWRVYNNQVILTNGTNTNAVTVYGISELTGKAANYFYNSVYIGGGANTGTAISADYNMLTFSINGVMRNNLLYNVRTNTGSATGKNYCYAFTVPTAPGTFDADFNDLYSKGTSSGNYVGLRLNTGVPKTFATWQTGFTSAVDSDSQNGAVIFSQSNPPVSDLTPASVGNCWLYGKGTPITTTNYVITVGNDYNNTTRNAATPDIGAIEFTGTALSAPVITATNVTCNGLANGVVNVTTASTGGVTPYQYSLNGGTYQTTTSFSALAPGSYGVVAEDANNCKANSDTVTVTQPAVLTAPVITSTNIPCYGQGNGTVTVSTIPTGGTAPYQYSLNGSAYQTGTGFTSLSQATYSVVAEDANNCTVTSNSVSITHPALLVAPVITSTNVTCYGANNGTVTVSTLPLGGVSPYQYSISGTYQTSTSFTSLSNGTYSVTVEDANGCTKASNSVTITHPAQIFPQVISGTNVTCYGLNNASVFVSTLPTGGNPPYEYSLNGGAYQMGISFSNLPPATYSVTMKDTIGCTKVSNSVTITQPAVLTAPVFTKTNVTCDGEANAKITVSTLPTGGTSPYEYSLNGVSYQSGTVFTSLAPGTYTVTARDTNGCTATSTSKTITQPTVTTTAGNGGPYVVGQNISLTSSSTGATSYNWSGPGGYTSSTQNPVISGATTLMGGTYTVTATTAAGCTATASTNVVVTTTAAYTWTGATSTDWTISTNWTPAAPTGGPNACAIDVVIPAAANAPIISTAVSVGNIQLNAGARLTVNTNLNICGNWTGGAVADATVTGTGVVILSGSSIQTVTGKTQLQELRVDNSAGVSMQSGSTLDIYTSLDLQAGNFDATNGTLTFKSNTTDSVGIIDNFSAGYVGTLTGNIIAERYFAASQTYNQHFIGSPVNSPAFAQLGASGTAGFVSALADCDETRLAASSHYGTVFSYHESQGNICEESQWKVEVPGNAVNGTGYSVISEGAGKLSLSGAANLNSDYEVTGLTNSNWSNTSMQHRNYNSGWQLLSNPYLATLQLDTLPAGFDNQVQVWNAEGLYAGSYQPGIIGTDAVVAPFQAFMVHKTSPGGSATYTINADERVRTPQTFYLQNSNELKVIATNTANGKLDQTIIAFNPLATDSFDAQLDAQKFPGALNRHTLYSVNNGTWMARNVLQDVATTAEVHMGFEPGNTSTYKFSFNGVNTFDPTTYIFLEDKTLNIMHNLRNGDYTLTADSADSWDRFVLHFSPPAHVATTDASCNTAGAISVTQPGNADWNLVLTDVNNAIVTSGVLNQSQPLNVSVPSGAYTLTLTDRNNYTAVKSILVNGPEEVSASMALSKDTVQVQELVTLTANAGAGNTCLWNFGNGQASTANNTSASYTQPGVYVISLTVTNTNGCSATQTRTITVTGATGLTNVSGTQGVSMWSHSNKVYVDFASVQNVDATVKIYNILGQEISSEHYTGSNIYQKEIDNIDAAYFMVMVKNEDQIITKKLLIVNDK